MGQTLTNGIFLPNEGERNCYEGLAGNWRAIDGYIGDYNVHVADAVIHVSQADRDKWDAVDNKADASALTAHTGDTTIHVTAEDKSKWNAVTAKANDADVMHLTGNEIVGGQKTLENLLPLKGEFLGTEASNNGRTLLYFIANRDTQDQSGIFLTKFRQNRPQGSMSGNDIAYLSFDCLENSVRTNHGLRINFLNFVDDIPQRFILWSGISEKLLGAVGAPWSDVFTDQINGLNPSALSMPDLSAGIDISGYITLGTYQQDTYTPPSDGYISIMIYGTEANGLYIYSGSFGTGMRSIGGHPTYGQLSAVCVPVRAGITYTIETTSAKSIGWAKFFPCQGNV